MRSLCFALGMLTLSAPAFAIDPCAGLTSEDVRQSATDNPLRMNGVPAKPVAVSDLWETALNGEPACEADLVITFDGRLGYDYQFLVSRSGDRVVLQPTYHLNGNPPPILLVH